MVPSEVRWWHCLPISAIIHVCFLAVCLYCLPDHSSLQVFAVEQIRREVHVVEPDRVVYFPMEEVEEPAQAVSEDVDPFEDAVVPSVVPDIVLEEVAPSAQLKVLPSRLPDSSLDAREFEAKPLLEVALQTAPSVPSVQAPVDDIKPKNAPVLGNLEGMEQENMDVSTFGAPHPLEVQGQVKPVAPSVSSGKMGLPDESSIWRAYTRQLSAHFKSRRHYPEMAKKLRITGTVWVSLQISREGTLIHAEIKTSSGSSILDQAALSSAQKAFPVPPFPENTRALQKTILIPYHYRM